MRPSSQPQPDAHSPSKIVSVVLDDSGWTRKHNITQNTLSRAFRALTECCCFVSVLQMEVVSTFKRSGSFQGAVRRRSSVLSQLHDVNTISTPSHVALSTATANTSPAPGSESAERMHTSTHSHAYMHTHMQTPSLSHTQSHLAARHVDCSTLTLLSGCVPSGSLAARLCAMFPLSSGPPL